MALCELQQSRTWRASYFILRSVSSCLGKVLLPGPSKKVKNVSHLVKLYLSPKRAWWISGKGKDVNSLFDTMKSIVLHHLSLLALSWWNAFTRLIKMDWKSGQHVTPVHSKKPVTRENWDKLSVYFSIFEWQNWPKHQFWQVAKRQVI